MSNTHSLMLWYAPSYLLLSTYILGTTNFLQVRVLYHAIYIEVRMIVIGRYIKDPSTHVAVLVSTNFHTKYLPVADIGTEFR